ncbi:MAG: hypothetical protein LBH43_00885 [Treponema sp.]|jgi:hypothetical protein|nr:hypothetical protein [Treponema sp.]
MAYEKGNIIIAKESQISFESVLDETCRVLEGKQIQYSLKRIREFDEILQNLEREIDAFTGNQKFAD